MKQKDIIKQAQAKQEKLLIQACINKSAAGHTLSDEELDIAMTYVDNLDIEDEEKAAWVVEKAIKDWAVWEEMKAEAEKEGQEMLKNGTV